MGIEGGRIARNARQRRHQWSTGHRGLLTEERAAGADMRDVVCLARSMVAFVPAAVIPGARHMRMLVTVRRNGACLCLRRRPETKRGDDQREDQQQAHGRGLGVPGQTGEKRLHRMHTAQPWPSSIHSAIATIITFSVSETNPSGTRLDPPTQAHLSSRFSM